MLVLNRKVGQRIVISDDIVITLVESRRGGARIGIEAPTVIPVHREEVRKRIDANAKELGDEAA